MGRSTQENPKKAAQATALDAAKAEAAQLAEDAHGDDELLSLLEETQHGNFKLRAMLTLAEADDETAEVLTWKRMANNAHRHQNELRGVVNEREVETLKWGKLVDRIGKMVGEKRRWKVAHAVERMARNARATAA